MSLGALTSQLTTIGDSHQAIRAKVPGVFSPMCSFEWEGRAISGFGWWLVARGRVWELRQSYGVAEFRGCFVQFHNLASQACTVS